MNPALAKIYANLPHLQCKGLCIDQCSVAPCVPAEADHLMERYGYIPLPVGIEGKGLICAKLSEEGKCSIYEDRPLICRMYGLVRAMKCPHGCIPHGGFMSYRKGQKLLDRAKKIPGKHEPLKMLEDRLDELRKEKEGE